jgi:signal peptidase I
MRTFIVCTILFVCCLAIACGWVYRSVAGNMLPTIQIGDSVVINKYAYDSKPIERFDIVVFNAPEEHKPRNNNQATVYVKRIIGLPNEKLEIRNNKIYINQKLLDESSFEKIIDENNYKKDFPSKNIPKDEYFLLGDNRPNSEDSRYWKNATVKKTDVLGKVIEIIPKSE